ncbi:MAG TPA: 16S rRNA (cytosine(1402)-N(4))-methyltransferase, partial [Longimicrobiales bacterium]|nr:16S rRNA (cytosine(1402)-N(4))-methyltransferase [Longimicrobiales bacterium]
MSVYHVPVLLTEVVEFLEPERGGLFFDGTLGGGGHSAAILEASEAARVVAADRDREALEEARARLSSFGARFEAREGDYADVAEGLPPGLAGALLDLGVSSHQIDETGRGFSFRPGSPLDMR